MKPPQIKRKTFLRWLADQPDDRRFNYCDSGGCLLHHFFKEVHGVDVSVNPREYRLVKASDGKLDYEPIPSWLQPLGASTIMRACGNGLGWLKKFLQDVPALPLGVSGHNTTGDGGEPAKVTSAVLKAPQQNEPKSI